MAKYLSNRQKNLKVGISSYTESSTVLEVTGKVGIGTTNAQATLDVRGDGLFAGTLELDSSLKDFYGNVGSAGSILVSTGAGISWSNPLSYGVNLQDEGNIVGYANTINFVGSAVTVISVTNGVGIVSITGGGIPIGTVAPSNPVEGNLWYSSVLGRTFVYYNDGSSSQWVDASPFNVAEEATLTPGKNTTSFTATAGQTTFSVNYQIGYIEVYVNGARLSDSEYTATNGTQIVLLESASEGDVVDVVEFIMGQGDPGPEGPAGASGKLEDLTSTTSASTHYPIIVTGVGSTAPAITTTTNYFSFVPSTGTLTANNLVVSGTSGTSLLVQGNARVVGILTIGSSSVTINGNSNQVNVGTAVTIHTGGFRVGNSDLHSNGLTVNNLNVSGVLTATTFVGDGSGLTGAGSTVSDDVETNATFYPVLTQTTSGTITSSKVSTTKLTFNPSSGTLSATTFSGNATSANYATSAGIATYSTSSGISTYSTTSGISTYSTTAGISTDATKLQTPRTISLSGDVVGSISFDGSSDVSIAATIQSNSVALGDDTTGNYVQSITGTSNQITVTSGEGEGSSPTLSIPNQFTIPQDVTVTRDLQVNRNLNVSGNITLGGTTAFINATELRVSDPDIVLGFRSDAGGNDISTDNTANHGGIAVASTEGSPLINLYDVGIGETNPSTYKKFMWFKSGTFSGLGTDAWISNYAVGIGSTQFPDGTRLATGSVQFTERDLSVVRNINSSGVVTATTFSGSGASLTSIPNVALTNSTISGVSLGSNLATLTLNTSGTGLSGSTTYNGSGATTFTVTSNATSANTGSTIVARDSSGNFSAGTISGAFSASADQAIVNQNNGNASTWYGRILSKNSTSDRASFLGTYAGVAGVFAHNNALSAWADLYVNTVDGSSGGTVRMPSSVLVNGNQVWHAGNDGSGSGLDADLLDGLDSTVFFQDKGVAPSNLNDAGEGIWRINTGMTNQPSGTDYGTLVSFDNTSDTGFQLASDYTSNSFYWRSGNGAVYGGSGSFGSWRKLWHDGNDGSGSGLDADLLDGVDSLTISSSNRANRNISGGGTITVDAFGNVLWSNRFIVISNGRGSNFASVGYFDITCPTSGTITGVGGAANKTATASGIPIGSWEAIYYILPIGSNNGSVAANFRVASYTADLNIPHDWVLICVRNGDNGVVTFNNGISLRDGESMSSVHQDNDNTANTLVRRDGSGNFTAGSISATGNVTAYSSDRRLKENFKHIESPLEKIQKLNGYTFDWNKKSEELGFTPQHKRNDVGLIAQEVQEVLPQAAVLAPFDKTTNENGEAVSKSGENYLTIQYERLVPLLIEAIKEQQEQINILKEEINNLKK